MTTTRLLAVAAACTLSLVPAAATAAVVLTPVTTVTAPMYVTHARDQRLFIVERAGHIRIFNRTTATLLPAPFLDISSKVSTTVERGLLSMAFHPDYASNGLFFVYYTNLAGDVTIERYHVTADANIADPNSAALLLAIPHPMGNHNGGQLQIGPEGHLYIGVGDGGGAGDPSCNAQRGDTLLGKLLRLDVRQNVSQAPFHGIPTDNPFLAAGDPGGQIRDEIWALGVRNPWRFSFDRLTGDMFVADVGQATNEEVDLHRAGTAAGQNFGWKVMEGLSCFSTASCPAGTPACNSPALTLPIHQYTHAGGECSITGGYVFRGAAVPELAGRYVFGDYCSGAIRSLRETAPGTWQVQPVVSSSTGLTSFGEDADGGLYATIGNTVFKLTSTTPAPVPALGFVAVAPVALIFIIAGVGVLRESRQRRRGEFPRT